ncbi:MAG: bifunctional 4-hydroxy-2-oxoglutarate aldolase/2-dehydro-3-deoxy-phosphogluconate aldolase [Actinomycetota bacterium]|nr:bifunctional 4-hydroxy-2-oxoglutarate aldolase/2-dehydro-3-deoxy-phosphogluconate aldolase [Actinomycetota bacterium]
MDDVLEVIGNCRVVAVLRAPRAATLAPIADVLVGAGVRAVEFALTSAGAVEAIAAYRQSAPPQACIGAGTVLSVADAEAVIDAGARYLVTPAMLPEVIAVGVRRWVPVLAGALTPTEILAAHRAGASAVKVFPAASAGGPGYLRSLREPLPDIALVPTGGVGIEDAADYLRAGALAVGLGGQLLGDAVRGGDLVALAERARGLVARLAEVPA